MLGIHVKVGNFMFLISSSPKASDKKASRGDLLPSQGVDWKKIRRGRPVGFFLGRVGLTSAKKQLEVFCSAGFRAISDAKSSLVKLTAKGLHRAMHRSVRYATASDLDISVLD
ncbi:hypothetical protein MHU86_19323 [Fragilaria crotonensis]|nr:hypothetical protein MHU86_19323 [Fragilaria crotonensis]